MNKTSIVALAVAAVAFVALWHGDTPWNGADVDAQQSPRVAASQQVVALLDVGDIRGFFSEVSGLGSTSEVVEHRDGGDPSQKVSLVPGQLKWQPITLKRGITGNLDMWEWRKVVEEGGAEFRKSGSITLLDRRQQPIAQWNFENAWPSKVTAPLPKADGNDVAVEEFTIVHEFIERVE